MEEIKEKNTTEENASPAEEMSLTDAIAGTLSSPGETFQSLSGQQPKKSFWLIMLLVMIFTYIGTSWLVQSNAELKYQIKQKIEQQRDKTEKYLESRNQKGELTQEQKESALKGFDEQIENIGTPKVLLTQSLWVTVGLIIQFFAVAYFFYFCLKFFFGAQFAAGDVFTVLGLAISVTFIETVLVTVYALLTEKLTGDFSVATLSGYTNHDFIGFLLGKLNLFSIWYFFIVSTGLTHMAKHVSKAKVFTFVFSAWILLGLLWFGITSVVPFLSPQ